MLAIAERLRNHSEPEPNSGCWLWIGARAGAGQYGYVRDGARSLYAHRAAYESAFGPIPSGFQVCHSCDTPPCVNPAHLFLGTAGDNALDRDKKRRGRNSAKAHCPRGHELSGPNLLTKPGHRECRICNSARMRRRYHERKVTSV